MNYHQESYTGKITRKVNKKLRIVHVAAGGRGPTWC